MGGLKGLAMQSSTPELLNTDSGVRQESESQGIARRDEAARGILLSVGLATEGGGEQI